MVEISYEHLLFHSIIFLKNLLEKRFSPYLSHHRFSLECMIVKQQLSIKNSIVNANNYLNRIYMLFDPLNKEFHLEKRLVDKFSSHFSFYKTNQSSNKSKSHHCNNLDKTVLKILSDLSTVIVISDTSIKNNVAISITHIHAFNSPLKKTNYTSHYQHYYSESRTVHY